jgi:hypothetical protein
VDDDEATRKKWISAIKMKQLGDNVQMVGVRRSLEIREVQNLLRSRGERGTAKQVADFLASAQQQLEREGMHHDDDDSLSAKKVETHLRVIGRVGSCSDVLLLMESELGPRHPLSTLKAMDMLCGLTSVENKMTSHALLVWCIKAIFVKVLRGQLPIDIPAPALKIKCIEVVRGMTKYLSHLSSPGRRRVFGHPPRCS